MAVPRRRANSSYVRRRPTLEREPPSQCGEAESGPDGLHGSRTHLLVLGTLVPNEYLGRKSLAARNPGVCISDADGRWHPVRKQDAQVGYAGRTSWPPARGTTAQQRYCTPSGLVFRWASETARGERGASGCSWLRRDPTLDSACSAEVDQSSREYDCPTDPSDHCGQGQGRHSLIGALF